MRHLVLFAIQLVSILFATLSAAAQSHGSTGIRVEDLRLGADIATVSVSLGTHHAVIDTVVTDSSTVLRLAPALFMDLDGFLALYFDSTDVLAAITWKRADMRHYHWPSQSWRDFPFWSPDVTRGKFEAIKIRLAKTYGEPSVADMPPATGARWLTRDYWIRLLFNEGELSYSAILGDPK
jgi:hypothetical protein